MLDFYGQIKFIESKEGPICITANMDFHRTNKTQATTWYVHEMTDSHELGWGKTPEEAVSNAFDFVYDIHRGHENG